MISKCTISKWNTDQICIDKNYLLETKWEKDVEEEDFVAAKRSDMLGTRENFQESRYVKIIRSNSTKHRQDFKQFYYFKFPSELLSATRL